MAEAKKIRPSSDKCKTTECKNHQNCVCGNGTEFKPVWTERGLESANDMDLFFKFEVCDSCDVPVKENVLLKKAMEEERKSKKKKDVA